MNDDDLEEMLRSHFRETTSDIDADHRWSDLTDRIGSRARRRTRVLTTVGVLAAVAAVGGGYRWIGSTSGDRSASDAASKAAPAGPASTGDPMAVPNGDPRTEVATESSTAVAAAPPAAENEKRSSHDAAASQAGNNFDSQWTPVSIGVCDTDTAIVATGAPGESDGATSGLIVPRATGNGRAGWDRWQARIVSPASGTELMIVAGPLEAGAVVRVTSPDASTVDITAVSGVAAIGRPASASGDVVTVALVDPGGSISDAHELIASPAPTGTC